MSENLTQANLPSHRAALAAAAATSEYPLPGGEIARLGEWLVRRGVIDRCELFTALDASFRHRCRLGDALVWLELVERGRLEAEASRFARYRERDHSSALR
jgi:hypothetical protein